MASDKQMLAYLLRKDLLKSVDGFRFDNRFASRAEALNGLVEWALEQAPQPDRDNTATRQEVRS